MRSGGAACPPPHLRWVREHYEKRTRQKNRTRPHVPDTSIQTSREGAWMGRMLWWQAR